MNAFSFIPAPTFAAPDVDSYAAALDKWKETVMAFQSLPVALTSVPAAPTLSGDSKPASATLDVRGPWETQWMELNPGKRSPKFTSARQAEYRDKESYCRALIEGGAIDREPEPQAAQEQQENLSNLELDETDL